MSRLRLLVVGAVLMLSAFGAAPEASALPRALSGNGSGTLSNDTCPGSGATCTATLNANIVAKFIGKSTLALNLVIVTSGADNGSGGTCSTATGSGQINTANKSTITLNTVGAICNIGDSGTPMTYNATYFISGGTLHFPAAAGTGLFAASIDSGNNVIVTLSGGFIK